MADTLAIDPARTALLVLDVQNDIVATYIPEGDPLVPRIARLVEAARRRGVRVIFVTVGFRPGYPEAANNAAYAPIRQANRLRLGSRECEVHPAVAPREDEVIIVKHRIGAFAGTDLELILRANGIDTLILCGIATSGVVLSTIRHAFDHDYRSVVVSDACADRDPEVHRILVERVFARPGPVVDTDQLVAALDA
jgi:nicotinamidase-related amidase